ncbi:MAG: hypothetical protein KAI66_22945, partial [Lentisphaeria bacterium]|nr:hypothetical protein [Lentisphaeria bacterium]
QPAVVRELLAADTTEALYESMQRHLADREAPEGAQRECNLLTVVTDNTDLVTPVLQALVSLKGVDTVVLDGKQASAHLRRVPMFSSFWSDCGDDTIKVIQAVVPRGLCNEAVRRIGNDVGDLTGHRDLLVTVQELAYCVGSLSK